MPKLTVAYGKVVRRAGATALDPASYRRIVQTAISSKDVTLRYKRNWRFSAPRVEEGFLVGKLGFVHETEALDTHYDEDSQDFIEETVKKEQSEYSRWVLDLATQVIAFERKAPNIQIGSFEGAFKALVNQHPETGLTLELLREPGTFFEWDSHVSRVTRFRVVLRPPNPTYDPRYAFIQKLLEGPNAGEATIELDAPREDDSPSGLKTDDDIIKELVEYQGEGYARIRARGIDGGGETLYDSREKIQTDSDIIPVATDAAVNQRLREFVRRRPSA